MSYPAKTKGYRNITDGGIRYRWRFAAGKNSGTVTLQGDDSGGQQVIVTPRSWSDPRLALAEGKAKAFTVTPKLVRGFIQQALAKGWEPGTCGKALKLTNEKI